MPSMIELVLYTIAVIGLLFGLLIALEWLDL